MNKNINHRDNEGMKFCLHLGLKRDCTQKCMISTKASHVSQVDKSN